MGALKQLGPKGLYLGAGARCIHVTSYIVAQVCTYSSTYLSTYTKEQAPVASMSPLILSRRYLHGYLPVAYICHVPHPYTTHLVHIHMCHDSWYLPVAYMWPLGPKGHMYATGRYLRDNMYLGAGARCIHVTSYIVAQVSTYLSTYKYMYMYFPTYKHMYMQGCHTLWGRRRLRWHWCWGPLVVTLMSRSPRNHVVLVGSLKL